jgi:hypothetical protein
MIVTENVKTDEEGCCRVRHSISKILEISFLSLGRYQRSGNRYTFINNCIEGLVRNMKYLVVYETKESGSLLWSGKISNVQCIAASILYTITIFMDEKGCEFETNTFGEGVKIGDELQVSYYLGKLTKNLFITKVENIKEV